MRISLTLDIPKELNDMSHGETAKLAMELKKITDELNFHLNRLDGENMSDDYQKKINGLFDRTTALENKISTVESKVSSLESRMSTAETKLTEVRRYLGFE